MDIDDFLSSTGLPDVSVDTDDALARAVRRGRRRRRRRLGVIGAGAALALVGVVSTAMTLADSDEPARLSTGPTVAAEPLLTPEPGDAAVWNVVTDAPPTPTGSSFTALVSRLGCNSGVTGRVLRPGVVVGDTEVVVTFTVEADPDGGDCPSNDRVPYRVELGVELGHRVLADGNCRPGGAGEGTSLCEGDGVRWRPSTVSTAAVGPHQCEAEEGSVLDVAGEPNWRKGADYLPWTDRNGCLLRIDVLAERPGPDHCGWGRARVLIVGQPLGTPSSADSTEYVRDPEGVFHRSDVTAGFDPDARLPDDAVDTGYRRNELMLWHVSNDPSAIWLVGPDVVERWPAGDSPLCL